MHALRRAVAFLSLACIPTFCYAADIGFQRSLPVTGNVTFSVCTASGMIHVLGTPGTKVEISAKIHGADWHDFGNSAEMKKLSADPPVEQQGNVIHVGNSDLCSGKTYRNIAIDYEISVPKSTTIVASSGAGDIHVESIDGFVRAGASKGNIVVNGIGSGSFLRTQQEPSTSRERMERWPRSQEQAPSPSTIPMQVKFG